jgi:hypothetical protein
VLNDRLQKIRWGAFFGCNSPHSNLQSLRCMEHFANAESLEEAINELIKMIPLEIIEGCVSLTSIVLLSLTKQVVWCH